MGYNKKNEIFYSKPEEFNPAEVKLNTAFKVARGRPKILRGERQQGRPPLNRPRKEAYTHKQKYRREFK